MESRARNLGDLQCLWAINILRGTDKCNTGLASAVWRTCRRMDGSPILESVLASIHPQGPDSLLHRICAIPGVKEGNKCILVCASLCGLPPIRRLSRRIHRDPPGAGQPHAAGPDLGNGCLFYVAGCGYHPGRLRTVGFLHKAGIAKWFRESGCASFRICLGHLFVLVLIASRSHRSAPGQARSGRAYSSIPISGRENLDPSITLESEDTLFLVVYLGTVKV